MKSLFGMGIVLSAVFILIASESFGYQTYKLPFTDLRFTNRAQCALDANSPTESAFVILDGYNAGKVGYSLAKILGQDQAEMSQASMRQFRLSVAHLAIEVANRIIGGRLPLLPLNIDAVQNELPNYARLVKGCGEQPYCHSLEEYVAQLWKLSDTSSYGTLQNYASLDPFQYRHFSLPTGKKSVGCFYIKRFSALQGHLDVPQLDQKFLTEIGSAAVESAKYATTCLDEDSSLDARSVALQLDLIGGASEQWGKYGFDFWNSFKIYLSWAWRNAPEMKGFNGRFDNLFRSLALEESIMLVPNGCKSITIPSCDSAYLGAASIREFAQNNKTPQHGEEVPQGPDSHLRENGYVDVNNDILNTRGYLSANDWVKNLRNGGKDHAGFNNYRGHMKTRLMSATLFMDLLTRNVDPDKLVAEIDKVIAKGNTSEAAKTEIYYLCTEFNLGASQRLDFLRSDIDGINHFDFSDKQEGLTNKSVQEFYNYFSIVAAAVLDRCENLEHTKYWNVNYEINKTGFMSWAKEVLQLSSSDSSDSAVTLQHFVDKVPFLVWTEANRDDNSVICYSASDCARQTMKAMVDFYAVGTYSSAFIQSETSIVSPGIFNPYAELTACKMYDPWFQTKRAWKMFALDMANVGAFGWNILPFFITGDIVPGRVTSFNRLMQEGKIVYAPNATATTFKPSIMLDFGPMLGAPCMVAISGDTKNPTELYAFKGVSVNYCSAKEGHTGVVSRPNQVSNATDSSQSVCGGCYLNFSAVGAVGVALTATTGFNPIKLGIYLFRAFERLFKNLGDSVNVPHEYTVDVNAVAAVYRSYREIPARCVAPLSEGLPCTDDICEARAQKHIETVFGESSYIESIDRIDNGRSGGMNGPEDREYRMTIRTPLCPGDIRIKFECMPDRRRSFVKEAQRGRNGCETIASQWSPWDRWRN